MKDIGKTIRTTFDIGQKQGKLVHSARHKLSIKSVCHSNFVSLFNYAPSDVNITLDGNTYPG